MPVTVRAARLPRQGPQGHRSSTRPRTERGLDHDRRWMVVDPAGTVPLPAGAPAHGHHLDGDRRRRASCPHRKSTRCRSPSCRARRAVRVRVWDSVCDALAASREADAGSPTASIGLAASCTCRTDPARLEPALRRRGPARGLRRRLCLPGDLGGLARRPQRAAGARPVPMNRFRPNFVVSRNAAYAEDGWSEFAAATRCSRWPSPAGAAR